jgi:tetratricopeptide (TPR) repeat protein
MSGQSLAQENNLKDVIKRVMPATVLVITYDASKQPISQGSGFFVSEKGEVITNYHVMSGADSAVVKLPDGNAYKITDILVEDITSDLIKLKLDTGGSKVKHLPLCKSLVEVGEKIVVIGSPQGLESTVSDGIVSAVRDVEGFGNIIQITAPISPGSSGSAVVNMKGEVIGVASAQMLDGQNLNFVVPAKKITELQEKKQAIARRQDKAKIQADDIYSKAILYFLDEDYKKALPLFKQYLQTHPDSSSDAWTMAGYCYGRLNLHQEAIQACKEAIRLKPDFALPHASLGGSYFELGRYQEAIQEYKEAIRLKPDFAEVHYILGDAYSKLGRYQEAIQSYKEAIRLKPDFAKAHFTLGQVYGYLESYPEAIQEYKEAIRLKPDYAEAHCGLGFVYNILESYQEAIQACKEAIRLKPDYAEAYYNLGHACRKLDRNQEAIQEYKEAIRLKPDYAEAYFGLGIGYVESGSYQDAIQVLKEAIRLKPNDAGAHYGLGVAYVTQGDTGNALEEYKILKNLDTELANNLFNYINK